jgi:ACT domain-containing protein
MIMLAELDGLNVSFSDFADELTALGKEKGLAIHAMHEDIFNTMHHI